MRTIIISILAVCSGISLVFAQNLSSDTESIFREFYTETLQAEKYYEAASDIWEDEVVLDMMAESKDYTVDFLEDLAEGYGLSLGNVNPAAASVPDTVVDALQEGNAAENRLLRLLAAYAEDLTSKEDQQAIWLLQDVTHRNLMLLHQGMADEGRFFGGFGFHPHSFWKGRFLRRGDGDGKGSFHPHSFRKGRFQRNGWRHHSHRYSDRDYDREE